MALLGFQLPAVAACLKHIYTKARIEWNKMQIHPPAVVSASVSSGKSRMICELAKIIHENAKAKGNGTKVLVLQRQGELTSQNSDAAWEIGLQNSCYSASLNRKSTHFSTVYATEGTVARALEKAFLDFLPDVILVDECHQCDFNDPSTQFMLIFAHFYRLVPHLRVIGFSGSCFRGTESIIGPFWNKVVSIEPGEEGYPEGGIGNGIISTEFMLANGWIVPLQFGWPEHEGEDAYDFSRVSGTPGSWEFNERELNSALDEQADKLFRIIQEVVARSADAKGVLIFGSTHRHLEQIAAMLKYCGVADSDIGSITEKSGDKARKDILDRAREGACKYVINVAVLTTGINVACWDSLVYLRPIGSLVLLTQSIGRVLRLLLDSDGPGMVEMDAMTVDERLALIAASAKPFSTVYDYAGVMDRLGSLYENPILEQAVQAHAEKKKELVACPLCQTLNSIFARRCMGGQGDHRCEHFFCKPKFCPECNTPNDPVARACRNPGCDCQLVDPNAALGPKAYTDEELTPVISMKLHAGNGGKLTVRYVLEDGREPIQVFWPGVGRDAQKITINTRVFYNNFVKLHVNSAEWRNKARMMKAAQAEKMQSMFSVPTHISARYNESSQRWNIGRRQFRDSGLIESQEDEAEEVA